MRINIGILMVEINPLGDVCRHHRKGFSEFFVVSANP